MRLVYVRAASREDLELLRKKYVELKGDPKRVSVFCDDTTKRYVLRSLQANKILDALEILNQECKYKITFLKHRH